VLQRLGRGSNGGRRMPLPLQEVTERLPQISVVFHNQNVHGPRQVARRRRARCAGESSMGGNPSTQGVSNGWMSGVK
jgi:hypothetical protein